MSRQQSGGAEPRMGFLRDGPDWRVPAATALAVLFVYWPYINLPPLVDDYGHIRLAQIYGVPEGWTQLFADPLYRCRATSLWLTAATLKLFGFSIPAFHASGLLLHILNTWLVYALGACRWIGWRASAIAALVFAANERPHEAVIWYASLHELLVFAFTAGAVLAWARWLERGRARWLAVVAACWLMALLSKESGVVLAALLPAMALLSPGRRRAAAAAFLLGAVSSGAYFWLAWSGQAQHQHFHDGTFQLGLHFAPVLLNSAARGLGIWGGLAVLALWIWRSAAPRPLAAFASVWYFAALLPYAFLTYMPRIPSRHHYLASAGMALLVAAAAT
ncbi:MAG: glycosyltransferase family 39 protein, partial [Bryobacteraceae bacterium]|nr:glycosyltransferase family 39 protein [Bryobacteraceae bacterium]